MTRPLLWKLLLLLERMMCGLAQHYHQAAAWIDLLPVHTSSKPHAHYNGCLGCWFYFEGLTAKSCWTPRLFITVDSLSLTRQAGFIWFLLGGYDNLQNVDWANSSHASRIAWLTNEDVVPASHPNRVLLSSSAATAKKCSCLAVGNSCLVDLIGWPFRAKL
jgi:hypothetical protein